MRMYVDNDEGRIRGNVMERDLKKYNLIDHDIE